MVIKRENWSGKYFIVSRNQKGQIVERVKWTNKENVSVSTVGEQSYISKWTLKEAIKRQNSYNSIRPDREVVKWSQTKEVTTLGRTARKPNKSFMIWVRIKSGDYVLDGRSNKYPPGHSKHDARNEAIYNALSRANPSGTSDDDTAGELLKDNDFSIINEGVVYYDSV